MQGPLVEALTPLVNGFEIREVLAVLHSGAKDTA